MNSGRTPNAPVRIMVGLALCLLVLGCVRGGYRQTVLIASSSSAAADKKQASIVCDGKTDAEKIMSVVGPDETIVFASGNYSLDQKVYVKGVENLTLSSKGAAVFKVDNAVTTTVSSESYSGQTQLQVASTAGFVAGQDIFIGRGPASFDDSTRRDIGPNAESATVQSVSNGTLTLALRMADDHRPGDPVFTINDAFYFDSCPNLKILNLTLDGNEANQVPCGADDYQNGMHFSGCNDMEAADNYVHDVVYNHILIHPQASLRAAIHNNSVVSNAPVTDGQVRGITVAGYSHGDNVSGNYVSGTSVAIYDVGSSIVIESNSILNSYRGIFISAADRVSVDDNEIDGAKSAGIYTLAGNSLEITRNRINGTGQDSMDIEGTSNSTISGNIINDGGQQSDAAFVGILIDSFKSVSSQGDRIDNNTIQNVSAVRYKYDIELTAGSANTTVRGNTTTGSASEPIHDSGANNTVEAKK